MNTKNTRMSYSLFFIVLISIFLFKFNAVSKNNIKSEKKTIIFEYVFNNIKEMKTDGLLNIKTDDIIKNFKNYKTLEKLTAVLSE